MSDLVKYVHDRCAEEGECWIWQLTIHGKTPYMGAGTRNAISVRRHLWTTIHGEAPPGMMVCVKCDVHGCVNPEHLALMTNSQVQKRAAKNGAFKTLARRSKIAQDKRAKVSKLTLEMVNQIRASEELQRVLAERYGVAINTISAIRNGKRWRDYSSPFAGLAG